MHYGTVYEPSCLYYCCSKRKRNTYAPSRYSHLHNHKKPVDTAYAHICILLVHSNQLCVLHYCSRGCACTLPSVTTAPAVAAAAAAVVCCSLALNCGCCCCRCCCCCCHCCCHCCCCCCCLAAQTVSYDTLHEPGLRPLSSLAVPPLLLPPVLLAVAVAALLLAAAELLRFSKPLRFLIKLSTPSMALPGSTGAPAGLTLPLLGGLGDALAVDAPDDAP
jgi:hypothetical protein